MFKKVSHNPVAPRAFRRKPKTKPKHVPHSPVAPRAFRRKPQINPKPVPHNPVAPRAFDKSPQPSQKTTHFISWQKLLGDIEALPMQDDHIGSLIIKDELFTKALSGRKVRVQPKNVREFFQYLVSTLHKGNPTPTRLDKNPISDKRPMPQRLEDLALFVRKVLCTIHKRKKMSEEIPIIIAGYNNIGEIAFY